MGFFAPEVQASGIDRNGIGARSMGMAGATLADDLDAVTSAAQNPAALGFLEKSDVSLGIAGAWASGRYDNAQNEGGKLTDTWGLLPEIVYRQPLADRLAMSMSLITDSTRLADWYFRDPAGGATGTTSYGQQHHRSSIINMRAALGLGWRLTDQLALGASVGLVYNRNELTTPYTFQTQPALKGFKTLLDLETEGFGANGDLALHWKPTKDFAMAFSYRTATQFNTEGTARGDVTRQLVDAGLVGVPGEFKYDAKVATHLPQKAAVGMTWQALKKLRVGGQAEWVDWSNAYDVLEVRLANGSNPAVNATTGSKSLDDDIDLNWKDSFVFRLGFEYELTESLSLRMGYAYGSNPVSTDTLLPTTAAISEHTLALGLGYTRGRYQIDLAYQYDLPAVQHSSARSIQGPEYKDSRVKLQSHWIGLTTKIAF
ncbi:OmpP1/FadL family transporter [Prosthecobacter fusiformis]|uniref:OmpP1/FadL family transporter n=1 Tax=Prosthecobacter fusiformis TaxID=48464 RepID=UPI00141501BB|nr:outer membrane protein transport protein [Prosthecobacter fusiformis]